MVHMAHPLKMCSLPRLLYSLAPELVSGALHSHCHNQLKLMISRLLLRGYTIRVDFETHLVQTETWSTWQPPPRGIFLGLS